MPLMWKQLCHRSSRPSLNPPAPAADGQTSSAASVSQASVYSTPSRTAAASVRSAKSSLTSQQSSELKDLRELLDFNKSLVHNLGEDLQKRVDELDKVRHLSADQEKQIDIQQAEIVRLSGRKTDLKCRVTELEMLVGQGKTRIDELVMGINALHRRDGVAANTGDEMVPLDGIVKDALIEQLESDVQRLTQQGFDHDREMHAVVSSHEHEVSGLQTQIANVYSSLEYERRIVAKHTWDLAEMTKRKETAEDALQQRVLREALPSSKSDVQSEKLAQALSYTRTLAKSKHEQDGKEVELFHLQILCGLAQTHEATIASLRAANTEYLVASSKVQQELKPAVEPAVAHRRNVTWDLPFRNNEAPSAALSFRRNGTFIPDLAPLTAPIRAAALPPTPTTPCKRSFGRKVRRSLSSSKCPTDEDKEKETAHLRAQLAAARSEVAELKLKLSANVEVSRELADGAAEPEYASAAASGFHRLRSGRDGEDGDPGRLCAGDVAEGLFTRYCAAREGVEEGQRVRPAETERVLSSGAAEYLFGDIPVVMGRVRRP